jgi:hypothetical protein
MPPQAISLPGSKYLNPVTPEFTGTVGIRAATDAIVKITDISGKLVWQSQANGGTAS